MTTCHYCADGDVYDLVFTKQGWRQKKTGRCKHCAGGSLEPSRLVRVVAERLKWNCVRVIAIILVSCYEFRLANRRIVKEDELMEVFQRSFPKIDLREEPEEEPIKAGVPMKDGFVPESDEIPF